MSKRKRLSEPFMIATGQSIEVGDCMILTAYGTAIARYAGVERDHHGMLYPVVVHFSNPDRLDCLIRYGQEWREVASAGLVTLGLKRPQP
jgi:hypothetical protein